MIKFNRKYLENVKEKNIVELGTTVFFTTTIEDFRNLRLLMDAKKIDYCWDEYDDDITKVYIIIEYCYYIAHIDIFKDYKITLDYEDQNLEIEYLIKECFNYDHYFIFSYNYTWDSVFAYKIVNNDTDLFYRDYDTSIYYKDSTKKGKLIKMVEYSHDSPTGATMFYIGLTDKEYEKVKNTQDINFILDKYKPIFKCL